MTTDQNTNPETYSEWPIDGTLDLHTFKPSEVKDLVPYYLNLCSEKGIRHVRIIHGKGTGTLRKLVRTLLERHPLVEDFGTPGHEGGSWGSTTAVLKTDTGNNSG